MKALITGLFFLAGSIWPLSLHADPFADSAQTFANGDYAQTISLTSQILQDPSSEHFLPALIRRGESYRLLGHYREAETDLRAALQAADESARGALAAIAGQALGQLLFQQQRHDQAAAQLQRVLSWARANRRPDLGAAVSLTLGQIQASQGATATARDHYEQAVEMARRSDDAALIAAALINLAGIQTAPEEVLRNLTAARERVGKLDNTYERAELLLAIAETAEQSRPPLPDSGLQATVIADALALAGRLDAPRLRSRANGLTGAFHESAGRWTEARAATERAIFDAQTMGSDDLLMKWQWQLGRVLRAQDDRPAAIHAYRRAVYHLQAIRQDIPVTYQSGRSSFRETLAPLYLGLADLLLQQAAVEQGDTEQALLREARATVERIKVSELQDYFKDSCIVARSEQIGSLAADTAVLYPIILPDRLELLLGSGDRLDRYSVKVPEGRLQATARKLVDSLRPTAAGTLRRFDQRRAHQLYQWLIRPLQQRLDEQAVTTLVFVPDGALRLLPIATLWDGERFLLQRYAIATVPGLTLLDPKPLPRGEMQALLAGLTRPGPVVFELPAELWDGLAQAETINRGLAMRGAPTSVRQLRGSNIEPGSRQRGEHVSKVQQALALPGVAQEISKLSENLQGEVLMDDRFVLDSFSGEVEENPYRVVHIASHGFFGGTPEQNFIMTYDRKLDMNRLAALLQPKRLAEQPVDLLTLSACQTAEGDDRSPLGLSGIALKSGARSALGTLWPIADEAAQRLLPAFYRQLQQPEASKAEALQQAQLALMKQEQFAHPFFWSAFTLIGNWL